MKTASNTSIAATIVVAALLTLAGCSTSATKDTTVSLARARLVELKADPQLAARAPTEIQEAESALNAAETHQRDEDQTRHLAFMADRKVSLAIAVAQVRLLEDQRKGLVAARDGARLESRTREANAARSDAADARSDAVMARNDADQARDAAAAARNDADSARRDADDLQSQIDALNAKPTDRGLVVALGDVLFEPGQSTLKAGSANNLGKLAAFLNRYPDRTVIIEGHTDSLGSDESNLALSQRRADAVRSYLRSSGVASTRLVATGLGETQPISSNDSATGRAQNRRVEVVIANPPLASR